MILLTKLTNGEEIISDTQVVAAHDTHVCLLKKPCMLYAVPGENGMGLQMVPWMLYAKDHIVPMPLDMIMTQVEVESDLYNKYNSAFGTGIQLPDSKIALA